jgi:hypothetical protein
VPQAANEDKAVVDLFDHFHLPAFCFTTQARSFNVHPPPHGDDSEMSDSEASVSLPSNAKIEQGLRKVIARFFQSGDLENLTLKRVRKATEDELDLPEDFFRVNDAWKEKSKVFITAEVVSARCCLWFCLFYFWTVLLTQSVGEIGERKGRSRYSRETCKATDEEIYRVCER